MSRNFELTRKVKCLISLVTGASLALAVGIVFFVVNESPEETIAKNVVLPRLTWETELDADSRKAEINFGESKVVSLVGDNNVELSFDNPNSHDVTVTTSFETSNAGVMTLVIPESWAIGATNDGILVRDDSGDNSDIGLGGVAGHVMLSISGVNTGSEVSYDTFHLSECENNGGGLKKCSVAIFAEELGASASDTISYVVSADGAKTTSDYFAFVGFNSENYSASNRYWLRLAVGERLFSASNSTQREAAWSAIEKEFYPYGNYWPAVQAGEAGTRNDARLSVYYQYRCHASWAAEKVPWNLEPARPNLNAPGSLFDDMFDASCNPTW